MMAEFSFGQVEAVLAAVHEIQDHKRVAFVGRLKMLQKNGLPTGSRPGRGKAGTYTFPQLLQFAIGVELLQFGVAPLRAASMVSKSWCEILHSTNYALDQRRAGGEWNPKIDLVWVVRPTELSELQADAGSVLDDYEAINALPSSSMVEMLLGSRFVPGVHMSVSGFMVLPAERIFGSLLWHIRYNKYLSVPEIYEQLENAEREFNDGVVRRDLPPWSIEWSEFMEGLLDEELIQKRVMEIVDRVPRDEYSQLAKITRRDINEVRKEGDRAFHAAGRWGLWDISPDQEFRLTRIGKAFVKHHQDLRRAYVDQEA